MDTFAALADPTRRRIVELLARRDHAVGELVAAFDLSGPAISQHLKVLRRAGLVTSQVAAQSRIQSLNPAGLAALDTWLNHHRDLWSRRLDLLERALREDAAAAPVSKPAPAAPTLSAPPPVQRTTIKPARPRNRR